MRKFRKKPVVIDAMTFDEMVEYGKKQIGEENLTNGMPWSFKINGRAITHEDDNTYLINTLEGDHKMTRDDMLIIGVKGESYPCKKDIFDMTYEEV